MNPDLFKLQAYPFEKLTALKAGVTPPADKSAITLSVGEPQHSPPRIVTEELISHLHGLSRYPATKGTRDLREAISGWLTRRFALAADLVDPDRHVLPVNGTREALFSFAQAVIDRHAQPLVVMPNPFYQIYEGAALLAGAQPWYLSTLADTGFTPDFDAVPDDVWQRTQLVYICSPGNPSGAVMDNQALQQLIDLADRHGFIIASDECYSEIYTEDAPPPTGLRRFQVLRGISQPVQALQCTGHALRVRRRRRRGTGTISPLPHLPRQRHAAAGPGGQHQGVGRRTACPGKPHAL